MRHSLFTIEVCARLDLAPTLLDALRPIVQNAPERVTRNEAWGRHAAVADVLLSHLHFVEHGCWEYFDDEAKAMSLFEDWCRPLRDRVLPRPGPSGAPNYRDGSPRFLTFTVVYLLARDSPSDLEVRRACNIVQPDLWKRETFRRLLGAMRLLSFASVRADAMYIIPRDSDWGLTASDLATETYAYLRPVEDS